MENIEEITMKYLNAIESSLIEDLNNYCIENKNMNQHKLILQEVEISETPIRMGVFINELRIFDANDNTFFILKDGNNTKKFIVDLIERSKSPEKDLAILESLYLETFDGTIHEKLKPTKSRVSELPEFNCTM